MKVFYKDKEWEISSEKAPTRKRLLHRMNVNPVTVLFIDRKENRLIPVSRSLEGYEEIEIRDVVSGG